MAKTNMKTTIKLTRDQLACLIARWKLCAGHITKTSDKEKAWHRFFIRGTPVLQGKPLYGTMTPMGNEDEYVTKDARMLTAITLDGKTKLIRHPENIFHDITPEHEQAIKIIKEMFGE